MRTPIAHALGWPQRIESGVPSLDLRTLGSLQFEAPDREKFRCLALAEQAGRTGGTAPTLLNAANEVAVESFLARRLNFTAIPVVIETVLNRVASGTLTGLGDVLGADAEARAVAREVVRGQGERT